MKRKLLSAIVLSTLMMKSPQAMEEEAFKPSHNVRTVAPNEVNLLDLPHDILRLIFNLCDVPTFFVLKGTCKQLRDIANEPRFCLAEDPHELVEQLRKFIDQEHKTFHFDELLPLMVRTKDAGRRLFEMGKDYVFDPQHPQEAQLKGLALWLAECAGHLDARERRNDLKKSFERDPDQAFFHLLPSQGGFHAAQFDAYKLMANFFEFSKKLAQSREKEYMNYGDPLGGPSRFRDISEHVSGVSIHDILHRFLRPDEKTKEMVAFFCEKEIASCTDKVHYLNKIFEKRKGTEKEVTLARALKDAADYAAPFFRIAINGAPTEEEKKVLYLKLATLQEKAGQWADAAESYVCLPRFFDDQVQQRTYFLKAASLFEKSGDMQSLADFYYNYLAPYFDDKRESVAYFLKAAALYEKLGQKREAAQAYESASQITLDETQQKELLLKAISL